MTTSRTNGYYILTKNVNAKQPYHFVLKAPNHETILNSENYVSKSGAINGIESVKVNGLLVEHFEKRISKASEPYFVLKASNGEIIGTSEMYSSDNACNNGITAVIKYATTTTLKEG